MPGVFYPESVKIDMRLYRKFSFMQAFCNFRMYIISPTFDIFRSIGNNKTYSKFYKIIQFNQGFIFRIMISA